MFALWAFLLWKFLDGPGRTPARNNADVILVGVLFSLGIESVQLFLPTRAADINDVFWNVLGTIAEACSPTSTETCASSGSDGQRSPSRTWRLVRIR